MILVTWGVMGEGAVAEVAEAAADTGLRLCLQLHNTELAIVHYWVVPCSFLHVRATHLPPVPSGLHDCAIHIPYLHNLPSPCPCNPHPCLCNPHAFIVFFLSFQRELYNFFIITTFTTPIIPQHHISRDDWGIMGVVSVMMMKKLYSSLWKDKKKQ